jgi:hypothetical protein
MFVPSVLGIGLSPSHRVIDFTPGGIHEIAFQVYGTNEPEIYVDGDLVDHIEVSPITVADATASFVATVSLPDELSAGTYRTVVGVREPMAEGGVAVSRTAVQAPVIVKVTSPDVQSPEPRSMGWVVWGLIGVLLCVNMVLFLRNLLSK